MGGNFLSTPKDQYCGTNDSRGAYTIPSVRIANQHSPVEEGPMSVSPSDEPKTKKLFLRAIFDFLWGFIAFAAGMVVSFFYLDIRPFLLATCLAFIAAGFYRGGTRSTGSQSKRLLPTAVFVAIGGILPAVIVNRLGLAWTDLHFLILFIVASSVDAALGVLLRSLIAGERTKYAALLGSIWALFVLVSVYKAVPDWMDSRAYVTLDRAIAPFPIQTLTGKSMNSDEWKGRVVVVSFWATWCTPCHAELPEIQALQDKYHGNPNVLIVALDSATGGDTAAIAQAYLDRKKLNLTGAIDSLDHTGGDSWGQAAKSLGTRGIPTVFILDRLGRLRAIHEGFDSAEHLTATLSRQIDQLL
jgi:thiol-disulfide isomerase/thioredoxin